MIKYNGRPATILFREKSPQEALYRVSTDGSVEVVKASQLEFETAEDVKEFNKAYDASISESIVENKKQEEVKPAVKAVKK